MTSRRLRERRLSRAAQRAEKPPPAPHPLAKFADKARDLDLVRKSVDDAASVSAGLWLSYLFALFYVGIAAGGVTHKDLLLENPVRLPFLNVELPFVAFFALAPVLFVVSHAYTLMHFVLLASKVGAYNTELARQIPEPDPTSANARHGETALDHREIRRGLRRQLPSNIFVQFLAGPLDIREGGLGWLLKAIAWITLVIGPVLLLLLIQVQFLPYHLEWVTWVQRLALLADVVLLWFLWPAVLDGRSKIYWPRLWRHPVAVCVSLVPIALAFVVARYPGEWVDEHVGRARWIAPFPRQDWHEAKDWQDFATAWLRQPGWTSVHDLVFNGDVDDVTRRRKSLFSNTLVLPEFDGLAAAGIDDPKKLDDDSIKHSLVLRGRHLKGAVLTHADLRKADLEAAKLEGANLSGARLQGARLDKANLQGASLENAQLQGASLEGAHLQSASLLHAQLQGASLTGAELQGARFDGAYIIAVNMTRVSVWRTSFERTLPTYVTTEGWREKVLSKDEFARLVATTTTEMPVGDRRDEALKRIETLNPDVPTAETSVADHIEKANVNKSTFQKALADQVERSICAGIAIPPSANLLWGLIRRIKDTGPFVPGLVEKILSPECRSSSALSEAEKVALKEAAEQARASETKQ